jgi:2-dehydro-3-deoxyphosphogluconate aldolase/(4S)-4-hydroxy-2-oxoglutarate aldolase
MAAKDRLSVLLAMMDQGVIPVFYDPDVEVCKNVIQACANGGAKCIEFTNRGDFAAHVFLDVTRHFAKADPSVVMGVGSVVDAPTSPRSAIAAASPTARGVDRRARSASPRSWAASS